MYKNINILSDSAGQSSEPSETFREEDKPEHSLQDLVEAEAGPEPEVGSEEVERLHEAELVHRDPPHSHTVVEMQSRKYKQQLFSCESISRTSSQGSVTESVTS